MDDKSKDNYKSRLDLKEIGIRPELHPVQKDSGKIYLPPSSFTLNEKEKGIFLDVLKGVKVPDGYASNISSCVQLKPPKLIGLKSHDYHILMQQLIPIALRKTLCKSVRTPLLKLSSYFKELCSKVIYPPDVIHLEKDIALVLCQLETIFPPSFFDIMINLSVHLAREVKLAGPIYYRLMYPIERYLGTLKSYVRKRGRPEGSIVEGYLAEECLNFCSLYLTDYVNSKFNQTSRNEDRNVNTTFASDIFRTTGHALRNGKAIDEQTLRKAHQYVLFNCKAVRPYVEQHQTIVEQTHPRGSCHQILQTHSETFADWFAQNVDKLQMIEENSRSTYLRFLANRPNFIGLEYKKFVVNGFRFHTQELERKRKTQNCGVCVKATTSSFSSVRDQNPILSDLDYYGIIKQIIELEYGGERKAVLFKCDWVSKGKCLKIDNDGFTLANFENVNDQRAIYPSIPRIASVLR